MIVSKEVIRLQKTIQKRVYEVTLPYPKEATARMVEGGRKQPYFFITDIAKLFDMKIGTALKICYPNVSLVMHTHVCDFYGYWRMVLFGKSKRNRIFQHALTRSANKILYENTINPYLKIIQKDKGKHTKVKKSFIQTFK